MNTFSKTIIGLLAIAVIGIGAWTYISGAFSNPLDSTPIVDESTHNATSTPDTMQTLQIKLAMLDTTGEGAGKKRGCDAVVMVTRETSATSAPLSAAMQALFAEDKEQTDGAFNYIARTNETLHFERATVANGTASIYLSGSLTGLAGVCDDPRAQIQIEETALQFPTVQKVDIYLNGVKDSLTPSER